MKLTPESECLDRLLTTRMTYYRYVYKNSKRWDGYESLQDKRVIVYCEQGLGDIIHFSRYFKYLKGKGCRVILHCPIALHKLMLMCEGVDEVLDKDSMRLPLHDYHVLSMSLPFLLGRLKTIQPYLQIKEKMPLPGYENFIKIGIAWEGNPDHTNNLERSCHLKYFKELYNIPNVKLFKLQKDMHLKQFVDEASDMELLGVELHDFYDTATFINALDFVVSVDTSVLHLSGAMGKRTYGLLSYDHDYRWEVAKWYSKIKIIEQPEPQDWQSVFEALLSEITGKPYAMVRREKPFDKKILFTGGIGDVITLESYFRDEQRTKLEKIYLATRAYKSVQLLFEAILPDVPCEIVWDQFDSDENFAFYNKAGCTAKLRSVPEDWPEVCDWSIAVKFKEIQKDYLKYNGSSFLTTTLTDRIELPKDYIVIVDQSPNDQRNIKRKITRKEWTLIFKYLKANDLVGVVLNIGQSYVPDNKRIIDLTDKTNILESIEILKGAKGYVGIDSCLSVLATKLFKAKNIAVKSNNSHLVQFRDVYYAPLKSYRFITDSLLTSPMLTSCLDTPKAE